MTNYNPARTYALAACLFLGVLAVSCRPGGREASPATDKPNVILIVLDGAPADLFGVYGCEKGATPRMDEIARKGAVFLNHFTTGIRTRDAVPIMMFSSLRPVNLFEVKGDDLQWGIRRLTPESVFEGRPERKTPLPEIMAEAGWDTAIFSNILYIAEFDRLKECFDEVYDLPFPTLHQPRDEALVSTLLKWLRERNQHSPFFVYYHVLSPHRPFPVKEDDDYFLEDLDPKLVEVVRQQPTKQWTGVEGEITRRLYLGNLKHSDRWLGVLFSALTDMGLAENTVIVITSDHGTPIWGKANYFYKVPLLIYYPPKVAAGVKVEALSDTVDIMPTILALAGVGMSEGSAQDGVNLLDVIAGISEGKRKIYIHDIAARNGRYNYYRREDIEEGLIREESLFDLQADPKQEDNIIADQPEVAARLAAFLEGIRSTPLPSARREEPPEFPFYFTFDHFNLYPPESVEDVEKPFPDRDSPGKSWLLTGCNGTLVRSPDEEATSLNLSVSLPDGSYRVLLMLETPGRVSLDPVELGLRFRFASEGDFIIPESLEFFGNSPRGIPRYYIELGDTSITGEIFSVEIDHQPRDEEYHYFRHIKFIPENIRQPVVHRWEDDITLALKMIGYLDYDHGDIEIIRPDVFEQIEWNNNLLLREDVTISASSYNRERERVENLLDNNVHTYWHVDEGASERTAWVMADFGEGGAVTVTSLAARPRVDRSGRVYGDQFFRTAVLQASRDGVAWTPLSQVSQADKPVDGSWRRFAVDNREAYRYYRLLIIYGHIGRTEMRFLSIADLAFFE